MIIAPLTTIKLQLEADCLDFQLLSETRYCEMDLVITSVALPPL